MYTAYASYKAVVNAQVSLSGQLEFTFDQSIGRIALKNGTTLLQSFVSLLSSNKAEVDNGCLRVFE